MAVSFNAIKAEALSQLNALAAATVSESETTYAAATAGTLTAPQKVSTDWPEAQVEQAILDAEYAVIHAIAQNEAHPERADYYKVSAALANGAVLPMEADDNTPFLGRFSAVTDSATGAPLLYEPNVRRVQIQAENTDNMFTARPALYALRGNQIFFSVYASVVVRGPAAFRAAFTGNIRCRDWHRPGIVSGALTRLLPKEGAWAEAFNAQALLFKAHLEMIAGSAPLISMPPEAARAAA